MRVAQPVLLWSPVMKANTGAFNVCGHLRTKYVMHIASST